ncbi:MAG: hydrogenase maturation peptidase HycI [Candidatus Hermodarchaeota archaeon]|jgi:hydrogenase 3 maturation protease|nr:hydrogenase maturation peptidase HycI [Candidatus Hermodarchaeota archaeon]
MESWEQRLKEEFSNSTKSVILGIGNDLKADDGVGPHIIAQLENQAPVQIDLINVGTVPENFISLLIEKQPEFILLLDAALMQAEPGTIRLIDKDNIGGIAFSSHQLPLTFFIEYLESNIATTILVLGIQPLTDDFAQPISEPVQTAANQIINTLTQIFRETI